MYDRGVWIQNRLCKGSPWAQEKLVAKLTEGIRMSQISEHLRIRTILVGAGLCSARQDAPLLRNSSANSQLPNGQHCSSCRGGRLCPPADHTDFTGIFGKQFCSELSGGNKQKVAFAKWLGVDCDIFIMDCPTRGIDIGVKVAMYKLIYELKRQGKSIVMISEELMELIGMSDRMLIMKNGSVSKEIMRSADVTDAQIIEYMI